MKSVEFPSLKEIRRFFCYDISCQSVLREKLTTLRKIRWPSCPSDFSAVKAAIGDGKSIGDAIKSYDKIMEIIGHDPMEDGSGLTDRELARLSDAQLRAMLDRLSK